MSTARISENRYHHGNLRDALLTRAAEVIRESGIEALTLRGLARDLGVSHAAPNRHFRTREDLLAALATAAFDDLIVAVREAAETAGTDAWRRLNAMGRGYLKWALQNPSLFQVISHPDVIRFADEGIRSRMQAVENEVRDVVIETQRDGRHPNVDVDILTLYTTAVPWGAALLAQNPHYGALGDDRDIDDLVARVIELVVPIAGRPTTP